MGSNLFLMAFLRQGGAEREKTRLSWVPAADISIVQPSSSLMTTRASSK